MNRLISIATLFTAAFILCTGCQSQSNNWTGGKSVSTSAAPSTSSPVLAADQPSPMAEITNAVAVLVPFGDSKVSGKVTFEQSADGLKVVADVDGLKPGQHGFHIHEFGDVSDSAKGLSAGGHYNPAHEMHGMPGSAHHHPGDMGNLEADANGHAHLEITLAGVTIAGDAMPILGRSVIVHANPDDGSQPTGNAGARVAGGVIGAAKGK